MEVEVAAAVDWVWVAWVVLGTFGEEGKKHSVDHLRCPASGCKCRLRPDVVTFDKDDDSLMGPVVYVNNLPLPARPNDAARVEVMLREVEWNALQPRELR